MTEYFNLLKLFLNYIKPIILQPIQV